MLSVPLDGLVNLLSSLILELLDLIHAYSRALLQLINCGHLCVESLRLSTHLTLNDIDVGFHVGKEMRCFIRLYPNVLI